MIRKSLLRPAVALLLVLLTGVSGCGVFQSNDPADSAAREPAADGTAGSTEQQARYDVTPLLHPAKKYFGVAVEGAPSSMEPVDAFSKTVGKKPNMVGSYASWGDGFNAEGAKNVFADGGLLYVSWEPFKPGLDKIADGSQDAYITKFAASVRKTNVPVAISFGHEMNGNWYAWGRDKTTPADFVAAWRHIHDLFQNEGATNVIWVWTPNVITPMPDVGLKQYYPGDAYVDWAGMIGYYALTGPHTFGTLYGPTMDEIRTFTKKPFFIAETAAQQGQRRRADVDDLFDGVKNHSDVLGFVWFNIPKRADWRIEISPLALAEYRKRASDPDFGFDIRKQ